MGVYKLTRRKPYERNKAKKRKNWEAMRAESLGRVVPKNYVRGLSTNRALYGLPQTFTTKMRYVDNLALSSSNGAVGKYTFRMNSIFDPDLTGTGHQPMWHDQIAPQYLKYVVTGSKIIVTFQQIQSAMTAGAYYGPVMCGLTMDENASVSSTLTELQENQRSRYVCLTRGDGGGSGPKSLYSTYSPTKDLGKTDDDDTVGASVGSNPSAQWFATVFVADLGVSTAATIIYTVEIEYTVRFSSQLNVLSS